MTQREAEKAIGRTEEGRPMMEEDKGNGEGYKEKQ
jgi:hypothetical protein